MLIARGSSTDQTQLMLPARCTGENDPGKHMARNSLLAHFQPSILTDPVCTESSWLQLSDRLAGSLNITATVFVGYSVLLQKSHRTLEL